ncbi:MAG: SHOCT domain-containing protein [Actinomycetota bacterium]
MLAAEFGSGQVLWSLLWFFLFFIWIMLIFTIFGDIIRSDDLSGWGKALWSIGIIILPFIGIFLYLIVRGGGMAERNLNAAKRQQEQMDTYIRDVAGGSGGTSNADELEKLANLHASGKLDDAEYAAAKSKIINA